jgi:hypothetical protein
VFWDLKPLEKHKSVDYIGRNHQGFSGHTFGDKLCGNSFDYSKMPNYKIEESSYSIENPKTPLKHGNAYWSS